MIPVRSQWGRSEVAVRSLYFTQIHVWPSIKCHQIGGSYFSFWWQRSEILKVPNDTWYKAHDWVLTCFTWDILKHHYPNHQLHHLGVSQYCVNYPKPLFNFSFVSRGNNRPCNDLAAFLMFAFVCFFQNTGFEHDFIELLVILSMTL